MTVSEEVAKVARGLTEKLPSSFLFMLVIIVVLNLAFLWFAHDVQITRIEAVVKLFQTCSTALIQRGSLP